MKDTYDHRIPDLIIDYTVEGLIELRQQCGLDDPSFIELHPIHVRLMAEKFGFIRTVGASEAATEAALRQEIDGHEKNVARLERVLLCVEQRTEHLFKDLCLQHDQGHEDLSMEVAKCAALTDIIKIAVDEFRDDWEGGDRETYGKQPRDTVRKNPVAAQTQKEPAGIVAGIGEPSSKVTTDWALRQPLDKSSSKFVLFCMAWKSGDTQLCCASTADIAEMTGQDRKTVLENIKRLSEFGLIVDTGEKGGPTKAIPVFRMATEKEYAGLETGQLPFEAAP